MSFFAAILSNEKELFVLMSQDDQAAFTEIFYHYEPRLYSFILKMTRSESDTQEILQELFIKLWTIRGEMPGVQNPGSYIFQMAVHRTINYLRSIARNTRHLKVAANRFIISKNTTEETIDYKEMQKTINRVVELLPMQQKTVYKLSRQQGLKPGDIAKQMKLSEKTVKNHLTEALRFIKDRLQESPGTAITMIIFLMKNFR